MEKSKIKHWKLQCLMRALFLVHRWPSPHCVLTWLKEGYRVCGVFFIKALIPLTSLQIGGETVETVADFIFLGSKITADGDCSHEIKRCLLLGRKVMTNLDSILKSKDITLSTTSV